MEKVLDASALLAYLEKEPGWEKVKETFIESAKTEKLMLMSVVNWGEVFYILIRDYGLEEARKIIFQIDNFPIELIPADRELAMQAAILKSTKKLGYMDSFAAALALQKKANLLTKDQECKSLSDTLDIVWI